MGRYAKTVGSCPDVYTHVMKRGLMNLWRFCCIQREIDIHKISKVEQRWRVNCVAIKKKEYRWREIGKWNFVPLGTYSPS
jgi:hypothetical protein